MANQALAQTAKKQIEHPKQQMAPLTTFTSPPAGANAPMATATPAVELQHYFMVYMPALHSEAASRLQTPTQPIPAANIISVDKQSDWLELPLQSTNVPRPPVQWPFRGPLPGSIANHATYGPPAQAQWQPLASQSYTAVQQQLNNPGPTRQPQSLHQVIPAEQLFSPTQSLSAYSCSLSPRL